MFTLPASTLSVCWLASLLTRRYFSLKIDISVFFKGMAMGCADLVPGVSGGTIAFISGIYYRLLDAIGQFKPSLWQVFRQHGFKAVLKQVDAGFLATLLAGILFAIASLARVISYLLEHQPIAIWSFFCGLILISFVMIVRQIKSRSPSVWLAALAGFYIAYLITFAHPIALSDGYLGVFLGGMIAICAMILPGISGSMILLLLGLYQPVLLAVKSANLPLLACFAIGCATGLATIAHLLSYLLKRFHDQTLALLSCLMLGTLGKIWPWREVISWRTNSSGEQVPLFERAISPWSYEQLTELPAQIPVAVICLVLGCGIVWALERKARY